MSLISQIRAASIKRESMEDVLDYFRTSYPGSKTNKAGKTTYQWQSKFADFAAPEWGIKRDSVMRRFQKGRTGEARTQEQTEQEYAKLGEKLPPILPSGGTITGKIWAKFSDGACEERWILPETVSRSDLVMLLGMSDLDASQVIVDRYMEQDPDEPIATIGDCPPPQLHFEPEYA